MLQRLRRRARAQEGFTLIELLVVILIIGILAAVAIPAFLGQKGKAGDADAKSDVNETQTAEESYVTNGAGVYTPMSNTAPPTSYSILVSVEPTLKSSVIDPVERLTAEVPAVAHYGSLAGPAGSTNNYSITAVSTSGVLYDLTRNADGTTSRTCQVPANVNVAGCTAAGGSAITTGTW